MPNVFHVSHLSLLKHFGKSSFYEKLLCQSIPLGWLVTEFLISMNFVGLAFNLLLFDINSFDAGAYISCILCYDFVHQSDFQPRSVIQSSCPREKLDQC